ncbi:MAG: hypothetical protein ACYC6X_03280 [Minisyncoccota bacterium]
MITDTDITKLKGIFATKKDLKGFATKKDLNRFATKEDLKRFATKEDLKRFATKEDLKRFATKDKLAELRADMQVGFGEVNEKIDTLAVAFGRMENTLDGIAGAIQDLRIENGAGAAHLARHDRQIEALAVATKVALPN